MIVVSVIGIILAFAVLIFAAYKKISMFLAAVLAAAIVALFGGLDVAASLVGADGPFLIGMKDFVGSWLVIFALGALLGALYDKSGGEEEKSEQEPLKLWGRVEDGKIVRADGPSITAQCFRVACQDGHMAAVFMKFADGKAPSMEQIKADWAAYRGVPQELELPSAPKQFLHYFEEPDRPQTRLDRNLEHGMAVSVGRLRPDTQYDYKFVCLSHNTLRGAAGGAVLLAELLCAKGYMD